MEYIKEISTEKADVAAIERVLDESLHESDFYCQKSLKELINTGMNAEEALTLLARHKSSVKYGYDLSPDTPSHLLELAGTREKNDSLRIVLESPFLLMKSCWLYEHAPYFYFFGEWNPGDLDSLISDFAGQYETRFLNNRVAVDTWKKAENPRRVIATTFWENEIIDPILLVKKAMDDNLEGIEICFDFHPFNYTKLLAEELTSEKREQIKEACLRSGIKVDIHSPIVGPYTPSPDPSQGTQRIFDPTQCI